MNVARTIRQRGRQAVRRLLRSWVIDEFHRYWYESQGTWLRNRFLGVGIKQLPLDIWLYHELIYELRPGFVVQTGISQGGSVLLFAHLLDLIEAPPDALVVGIDIELTPSARALKHPRIRLIEGSSTDAACFAQVQSLIKPGPGLVSLDSDHSCAHVARELELYAALVQPGSYLVVEDTNVNGHPVIPMFGPGPYEATVAFLERHTEFERDDARWQRNLFSFHQYGWLKRVR